MPQHEVQPLKPLFKLGENQSGTCEVCKQPVDVMYIKGVIIGHAECVDSDYDINEVAQNIIELGRD